MRPARSPSDLRFLISDHWSEAPSAFGSGYRPSAYLSPSASSSEAVGRPRRACLGLSMNERVRAIRTGQLHALPRLHFRPIDVVVDHGSCNETWS
jgi:hypothetical protein